MRRTWASVAMVGLSGVLAIVNTAMAVGLARGGANATQVSFQALVAIGLAMWTVGETAQLIRATGRRRPASCRTSISTTSS